MNFHVGPIRIMRENNSNNDNNNNNNTRFLCSAYHF